MIQKEVIFSWLEQFGTSPSFREAEGAEWLIDATFKEIPCVVVRPKNDDRVVIQRSLSTGGEVLAKIKNTNKEKRRNYIYSLKRDFLLRSVRFKMSFEDEAETIVSKILIETSIYEDSITKNEFSREFNSITDATYLFLATTNHFFKV